MRSRGAGFTLVELLVVIAIITILAALLLPVLGAAKRSAQGIACMSNLKNVGIALDRYLEDNRGYFPYTLGRGFSGVYGMTPGYNGLSILDAFYLKSRGAFFCPSTRKGVDRKDPYNTYNSSYGVVNGTVFGYDNASISPGIRISAIPNQSQRMAVSETSLWIELRPDQGVGSARLVAGVHGGEERQCDVLFLDSHVKLFGAAFVNDSARSKVW